MTRARLHRRDRRLAYEQRRFAARNERGRDHDVVLADLLDHPGALALLLLGRQLFGIAAGAFGAFAEIEFQKRRAERLHLFFYRPRARRSR